MSRRTRSLLLAGFAALAIAQQPGPNIQVTTRLVQVSVLVLDNKGNPVEGLKKEDFELFDKGKPQTIAKFSMDVRKPDRDYKPLAPGLFTNAADDSNRVMQPSSTILLYDGLNTPWADQVYARQQMVKFLGTLQRGDKVAIYALGRDLRVLHEFSDNIDSLTAVAKRVKGQHSMELADANIDTTDIQNREVAQFIDAANQRMQDFVTANRVQSTLSAIEAIANQTKRVPGRKNLVWLSASFPLWIGLDAPPFDPATQTMYTGDRRNFADDVERTVRKISDANIAIYPVDVRGLIIDPSVRAEVRGAKAIRDVTKADPMKDTRISQDSMSMIAERTGGKAYMNTNDLSNAIRHTIDETRVSYVLSFYPTHEEWNSKWRDLKVKASRSNVHLRYRTGYVAYPDLPPAKSDIRADVEEALRSPVDVTGLRLGAYLATEGTPASILHTVVSVLPEEIKFTQADGKWKASLDVSYLLIKPSDKPELIQHGIDLNLTKDQFLKLRQDGIVLRRAIPLTKRVERVKVVVVDRADGTLGSLSMSAMKLPPVAAGQK